MTLETWRALKRLLRLPLPNKPTKPVQPVLVEPIVNQGSEIVETVKKSMPQELIDLVVDELAHRTNDLLNVSLVSTRWRASALRHLFKFVTFPSEKRISLLTLCKHHPHLVRHVKRLRIHNSRLPVTVDMLQTVMSALFNLQELQLFSVILICDREPSPVVFPGVTSLVIEDVRPIPGGIPYRLTDLMKLFPCLRDVIMDVADRNLIALPSTYVSPILHLRTLHLSTGLQKDAGMANFARRAIASCTIFQSIDTNPATFQFISAMSQSLEKLTLMVTPPPSQSPIPYPPVANFPRLRTIILDIRGFDTYLTAALEHLPAAVPELVIQFRQYYELGWDPAFRWQDLEAALSRLSLKKLVICRELDYMPTGPPYITPREERRLVQRPLAQDTKEVLEKNLSSFIKRGILHWETDLVVYSGLLSDWTYYVDSPIYRPARESPRRYDIEEEAMRYGTSMP